MVIIVSLYQLDIPLKKKELDQKGALRTKSEYKEIFKWRSRSGSQRGELAQGHMPQSSWNFREWNVLQKQSLTRHLSRKVFVTNQFTVEQEALKSPETQCPVTGLIVLSLRLDSVYNFPNTWHTSTWQQNSRLWMYWVRYWKGLNYMFY